MRIVFFLYDGFTVLDAVGPFETLSRLPGAEVTFVAKQAGLVANDNQLIDIYAPQSIDEVDSADILVVPGGFADEAVRNDPHQMDWIKKISQTTQVNASICTGSLIFAAAGLLTGKKATTHWARYDVLESYGAIPVAERWVDHGDIITAAGVSAGIDMGLHLSAKLAGDDYAKALQLAIEYAPEPPFQSGRVSDAAPEIIELVAATMGGGESPPSPRPLPAQMHRVSRGG
ncbi:MAG: DJ-1/PfpI family protein [Rhodobiaceae bacterium]|nr:DJ-1/PfpI family protein [Rhodobiaceae bacterium]